MGEAWEMGGIQVEEGAGRDVYNQRRKFMFMRWPA
jgi:hypothetical protein